MAVKDTALGKRAKISQAQQYMLAAVLGASIVLGATLSLMVYFMQQIDFNKEIIMAEDQSIVAYSNTIKTTGVCPKPTGDIYSDADLDKCDPNNTEVSKIPGTLRAYILNDLAANSALNSVPMEASSTCINPETEKNYTYDELEDIYAEATASDDNDKLAAATKLMKSCSALRIIPDALPAFRNEEALLASLNKLFIESDWQPESLSPGGTSTLHRNLPKGLNALSVNLSVEANTGTTMRVLHNVERSIREFNVERATIEWSGTDTLTLQAIATAYYMDESSIVETNKTIKAGDDKK